MILNLDVAPMNKEDYGDMVSVFYDSAESNITVFEITGFVQYLIETYPEVVKSLLTTFLKAPGIQSSTKLDVITLLLFTRPIELTVEYL